MNCSQICPSRRPCRQLHEADAARAASSAYRDARLYRIHAAPFCIRAGATYNSARVARCCLHRCGQFDHYLKGHPRVKDIFSDGSRLLPTRPSRCSTIFLLISCGYLSSRMIVCSCRIAFHPMQLPTSECFARRSVSESRILVDCTQRRFAVAPYFLPPRT